MAFLTLEDPNARIKGSRDPLGMVAVWSSFGRRAVGNLTTASTSVRGFTTLLLARYFAQQLVDEGRVSAEDALNVFLRMEQMCGYVRYAAHRAGGEVRGIERVRANAKDKKVLIHHSEGAILSDQKTYGLWGLYSVPSRTSGLIPEGPLGVTARAQRVIEDVYLPLLAPARTRLERLLCRGGDFRLTKAEKIFASLAKVLQPKFRAGERALYGNALRDGDEVEHLPTGRQRHLRELLETSDRLDDDIGREDVLELANRAAAVDEGLSSALADIATLESFLAPSAALFEHLLACGGKRPKTIATSLTERWDAQVPGLDPRAFGALSDRIAKVVGIEVTQQMVRCQSSLSQGQYQEAIAALLHWNALIMGDRKAGPWVRVSEQGKIDVLYRLVEQELPAEDELPTLWRNSYFLPSLQTVTTQLRTA